MHCNVTQPEFKEKWQREPLTSVGIKVGGLVISQQFECSTNSQFEDKGRHWCAAPVVFHEIGARCFSQDKVVPCVSLLAKSRSR